VHAEPSGAAAIDAARKAGNLTAPPGPAAQTCTQVWVPLGERGRAFAGQVASRKDGGPQDGGTRH
jgi:hypothetical protein